MSNLVGIFRTKDELHQALNKIKELKDRYKKVGISSPKTHMNYELIGAWELDSMLEIAHTTVLGAVLREESRGAHSRRDFPSRRDAEWMKHTVATLGKDGEPNISYKDVKFTQYEPMERKY
jgi:succinate dehydrogenase / fumarate reductase flavoprotein subunit